MGSVTVEREASWRDRARVYIVTIDGERVGKLAAGERGTFPLESGLHEVRMKIDWCGSPPVTVDDAANTHLVCGADGNAFTALFDVIFRTGSYISLTRA